MHTILRSVVDAFIGLGQIGTFLAAKLAAARGHALDNSDTLMAAIGLTSLIFSTLSSIGLCVYRNRLRQVQLWAKHAIALGKTEQRLQSALISGFDEAFVILDPPIDCGERGMSRLQECLAGPDADALAAAIQTL